MIRTSSLFLLFLLMSPAQLFSQTLIGSTRDSSPFQGRYLNSTKERDSESLWFLLGGEGDQQLDEVVLEVHGDSLSAHLYREDKKIDTLQKRIEGTGSGLRIPKITRWFWEFLFLWGHRDYSLDLSIEDFRLLARTDQKSKSVLILIPFSGEDQGEWAFAPNSGGP